MLKVVLFVYPQFHPLLVSIPQSVFGQPQYAFTHDLFQLKIASIDGNLVVGECNSLMQPDGDLALLAWADMIIIPGWHDLQHCPDTRLLHALTEAYQRGAFLVGLCFGTYVLAYTGLLQHRRATTHWLASEDFQQRFPQVHLDCDVLYTEDERIITSAGTSAGLDCCLFIIRKFYGSQIANKMARLLVAAPHREGGQAQFIDHSIMATVGNSPINHLLTYIQKNPSYDYRIDDLAQQLSMSRRTFTRHIQRTVGMSFHQWLIKIRLQHSLELLENSALSIDHIADKIGFQNTASFRQHFKRCYHINPQAWRKNFIDSQNHQ